MKKLSNRQEAILSLLIEGINRYGVLPTLRELGDVLGIASTNGVNDHLKALLKKGYIRRKSHGTSRGNYVILFDEEGARFRSRQELIDENKALRKEITKLKRQLKECGELSADRLAEIEALDQEVVDLKQALSVAVGIRYRTIHPLVLQTLTQYMEVPR